MNNRILTAVVLVIALLLGFLFYSSYERYEELVDRGWSSEAYRNPYLALELFSEKNQIATESFDSFLKIESLADFDTLFLSDNTLLRTDKHITEVLQWVAAGGHLMIGTTTAAADSDGPLLDELEISVYETEFISNKNVDELITKILEDYDQQSQNENSSGPEEASLNRKKKLADYEKQVKAGELTTINLNGIEGDIRAHFDPATTLDHLGLVNDSYQGKYDLFYWAGSDYGSHFLQFDHGTGLISVLSDPSAFNNQYLNKFDNAYLWQVLTRDKRVGILYGNNMPSLWAIMKQYMPETLLAFGLFLLLWIWYNMRRFGAVEADEFTVRRSFAEHIEASAMHLWQGQHHENMLESVREDIQLRAERLIPYYSKASEDEKIHLLAQQAKLAAEAVHEAMTNKQPLKEESFINIVNILRTIRGSL